MIGARERVENVKISPQPSCAAVRERGRDRVDVLGPMHIITSSRRGSGGVRAHSDNHAQRELQRDAQVAREAERIENGDRAAAGADMLMQKMLLVDCRLKVFCIMLCVPVAAVTTFSRLRPRGAKGAVKPAWPRVGWPSRAAAALLASSMGHPCGS